MFTFSIGIICTLLIFFIEIFLSKTLQLYFNLAFYIITLFFIRISVMNNNAILPVFPKRNIVFLSLLSNFGGFTINVIGLLILVIFGNYIPEILLNITRESWWLLIFTVFTLILSILSLFSPSGTHRLDEKPKKFKRDNFVIIFIFF
jgi:MFS-type transporter involved in bile tolerance (Atg22 family)